jgi:hypothetical protein
MFIKNFIIMKKTTPTRRAYNGSTPGMIISISKIADHALNHAERLFEADTTLTAAYLADLRKRIDDASRAVLGADNASELRHASIVLRSSTAAAAKELGLTKAWIERKYAAEPLRRGELLDGLGFTDFYKKAVNKHFGNEMMHLLARFDERLGEPLAGELVAAGLPARIAALRKLAASYSAEHISHKVEKTRRKVLTSEDLILLNGLYAETLAVGKLAVKVFENDPEIREGFVFQRTTAAARNNGQNGGQPANKDAA